MKCIKQDGISSLEVRFPPPSNMKFQIWFTIWVSLEKQFGAIVSWVLNDCCEHASDEDVTPVYSVGLPFLQNL